ncbi:MAG: hypothetical protein ABJJ53_00375 [Sulfitobacter sp.]
MSRKRTIALSGLAVLGGLALIENATRSVTVLPATVIEIVELVPDAGPDRFQVMIELAEGDTHALVPQSIRPVLHIGDALCVQMHKRSWAAPKFQKSSASSC